MNPKPRDEGVLFKAYGGMKWSFPGVCYEQASGRDLNNHHTGTTVDDRNPALPITRSIPQSHKLGS